MTDRYESRAATHADDCWSWGPAHYDCAVREIERLREELSKMQAKPVAAVVRDHDGRAFAVLRDAGADLPDGTELYAAIGAAQAQPKRRPYNASASLSEYGIFPECDAAPVAAQAQAANGDALDAARYRFPRCFVRLAEAAKGLSHGTDWNNGTHARGYRQKLLEALNECDALLREAAQPEQITPKQLARLIADNPDVQFSVKPRPADEKLRRDAENVRLREALEMMVEMVEMNGFGRNYVMDVARAALAQEQGEKHDNQD